MATARIAKIVKSTPLNNTSVPVFIDEIAFFEAERDASGMPTAQLVEVPSPLFAICAGPSGPYLDTEFASFGQAEARARELIADAALLQQLMTIPPGVSLDTWVITKGGARLATEEESAAIRDARADLGELQNDVTAEPEYRRAKPKV
ncbi:hypothetical protein L2Y96_12970 [Luteibacter aegosomaticola]|uniref:hypothetical protein n=1 Tax=Luteibacter aegosomaticola TaxID=2911538 RepID=UPI001FFBF1EB|nr:hypothetical protein [Luteibacter aegosomaticola]UPG88332.1 hypothetical protein L2Y96_12970 [Luteibacter aegosomaticola]